MAQQPIENYGIVGNMRSTALISMEGSIDFFCFPDFDSPTVFASLLDPQGGSFRIQAELDDQRFKQLYLPDTNILLTRFLSGSGVAEITDFMPILAGQEGEIYAHQIIRMVRVIKGEVQFRMCCAPRFNYVRSSHVTRAAHNCIHFEPECASCLRMTLHSTVPVTAEGSDAIANFTLEAGQTATFTFGEAAPDTRILDPEAIENHFRQTASYWRDWIARSNYSGRWREMVNRSALALKLLCSQEYGSLIAAPTFGLPERIGGERNWDYRYTWLRDAAFSLYAFMRLGFTEEAQAFTNWLHDRLHDDAEHGPLQVMYRMDGRQELDESVLENFKGYKCSRPVRIGNAASKQLQLDIYGEIMDAIYLANKYGDPISHDDWDGVRRILEWLEKNWKRPDEGIWEVRGGRKKFLHSRLMCWVAFDRASRLAGKRSLPGPLENWLTTRDAISEDIFTNFWDDSQKSFVQYQGSNCLDASSLLMPLMRFISPVDPRWLSTMEALEKTLTEDSLVYRYDTRENSVDGLPGREGSFTACSFWFIECLARSHQLEKARLLFDKMLGYANHLGLYSEQLGSSGEHLGNFPQAFTHLALISAATYLDRALSGKDNATWR
ncbi:glycoside hydrolase family 15 protein [Alloacidobacterium sp.]|uniref:glycoside hydrolase family 15 protein n=1 Tax=Alloacidobacterium sp. TaxID=2951999 RepID=UPI002D445333|nr:glycoside hydrolase family 15 protein [Alloacidobacterium sp.]HYK34463.1 glycoside hydrolase family 15 protein [Alloacidobacterium sp.]